MRLHGGILPNLPPLRRSPCLQEKKHDCHRKDENQHIRIISEGPLRQKMALPSQNKLIKKKN